MAEAHGVESLEEIREQIDGIDAQLLDLLNRRAAAALEIGRRKRARNQPIFVPEREKAVLERLVRTNGGPLDGDAVTRIFETIIGQIRALEESPPDA